MQIKDVWQCCYGHDNGWQVLFNTIEDDRVAKRCTDLLNRNCQAETKFLLETPDLSTYGIYCDDLAVYCYKIQYGLSDVQNRSTSFSHAYIFPWNDNVIAEPNTFLTLDESNFKSSLSEVQSIQNMELTRREDYSLMSIFPEMDIDMQEYRELIDTIFYRFNSGVEKNSIYVKYDGSYKQMCELLYCIFVGVPFHLRKKITARSHQAGNATDAALIFSPNALNERLHLDPGQGVNNNVLNLSELEEIDQQVYVNAGVRLAEACINKGIIPETKMRGHFAKLDRYTVEIFGNGEVSDGDINVAHKISMGVDPDNMNSSYNPMPDLVKALSRGITGNNVFDDYIMKLVMCVQKRKTKIPEKADAYLAKQVAQSRYNGLKDVYQEYCFQQFIKLSHDEQVRKLSSFDKDGFVEYANMLMRDQKTRVTLDQYFETERLKVESWDNLLSVIGEIVDLVTRYYRVPAETAEVLKKKYLEIHNEIAVSDALDSADDEFDKDEVYGEIVGMKDRWPLASQKIVNIAEKLYSYDVSKSVTVSLYRKYEGVISLIFMSGDDGSELEEKLNNARTVFWEMMSPAWFSFKENYDIVKTNSEVCFRYEALGSLVKDIDLVDDAELYGRVNNYFAGSYREYYDMHAEERDNIVRMLESYANNMRILVKPIKGSWLQIAASISNRGIYTLFDQTRAEIDSYMDSSQLGGDIYARLVVSAYRLHDALVIETERGKINRIMAAELEQVCMEKEKTAGSASVPLDLWLIGGLYENQKNLFCLLEKKMPSLLEQKNEDIVKHSLLLLDKKIIREAKLYVSRKGLLAKQVKIWLDLVKDKPGKNYLADNLISKEAKMEPRQEVKKSTGKRTVSPEELWDESFVTKSKNEEPITSLDKKKAEQWQHTEQIEQGWTDNLQDDCMSLVDPWTHPASMDHGFKLKQKDDFMLDSDQKMDYYGNPLSHTHAQTSDVKKNDSSGKNDKGLFGFFRKKKE